MSSFMSILDKFEAVKIENIDRVSSEDVTYCEYYESVYYKVLLAYTQFKATMESLVCEVAINPFQDETYSLFVSNSTDIRNLEDRIKGLKNSFVNKICYYFAGKYNVTIDHAFKEKYDEKISYNNILDEIFIQLGGASFEERAVIEIKNKMKQAASNYHGDPKIIIKNKKLVFDCLHMVCYDDIWNRFSIARYDTNAAHFFTALCHFDHNRKSYNGECKRFIDANSNDTPDLFNKYEFFTMNKLKTIKFYKNGRIDIEFATVDQAREFAKEYCGYIERKEAKSA